MAILEVMEKNVVQGGSPQTGRTEPLAHSWPPSPPSMLMISRRRIHKNAPGPMSRIFLCSDNVSIREESPSAFMRPGVLSSGCMQSAPA